MDFRDDIAGFIKSGCTSAKNLGLEIEHFPVDKDGMPISFGEITSLIEELSAKTGSKDIIVDGHIVGYQNSDYTITLEPSCQLEISIRPTSNLSDIRDIYADFIDVWTGPLRDRGYELIYGGNLPIIESGAVAIDEIPLSDKKRYEYMDAYFRDTGSFGAYMMRASASTQVSVDYSSESDLRSKVRILSLISPILMMMMECKAASDATLPGAPEKTHLLRIQEWNDLDDDRTGFMPHSLDDDFGYDTIADMIYDMPLILLTDEGRTEYVGSKSIRELIGDGDIDVHSLSDEHRKSLIEHCMSMGFHHLRIKTYIEIRIADSVPIERALGYLALIKGIIYSDDARAELEAEFVGVRDIYMIDEAIDSIMRDGFDAVYCGKTIDDWARHLKSLAGRNLSDDDARYLEYV